MIGGLDDNILLLASDLLLFNADDCCKLFDVELAALDDESVLDKLVLFPDASVKRITGENKFSNLNGFSVLNFF